MSLLATILGAVPAVWGLYVFVCFCDDLQRAREEQRQRVQQTSEVVK